MEIEIISMEDQDVPQSMRPDPVDENDCEDILENNNQEDENSFRDVRFESLFRKIAAEDEAELLELDISGPSCSAVPQDKKSANTDDVIAHTDNILPQELGSLLERLLQTNCKNLDTIRIRGVFHLGKLSFPPLVALTRLTLTDNFGGLEGLWAAITSIDYARQMPGLEEMEIIIRTVWHLRTSSKFSSNFRLVWPEFDVKNDAVRKSCCSSIRKLTLELEVRSIRLFLIRDLFPNVPSLEFRMNDTSILGADPMPIAEISRLWPNLQELRIGGQNNNLLRNYDADVIGITEAEAELLRDKDEEYLEKLQIVPVKPSLITMTSTDSHQFFLQFSVFIPNYLYSVCIQFLQSWKYWGSSWNLLNH